MFRQMDETDLGDEEDGRKGKMDCEEKINKKKMWKCSQASLEQVAAM